MTDLDARYGRRPPMSRRRRTALGVVGLVVAVLAVVAFYFWWAAAQDPFSARIAGFDVVSDTRTDVSVEIVNRGGGGVRCEVVAQDATTQVVGSVLVEAPSGRRSIVLTSRIPTTARAVVAQVRDCGPVPSRVP